MGCKMCTRKQNALRKLHDHPNLFARSFASAWESEEERRATVLEKAQKIYRTKKIRYVYCGEYGEQFGRPHYHMCLFGHDYKDKERVRETADGTHYTSMELSNVWGKGKCEITDLNFKTAAYVARYVTKKVNGKWGPSHYGQRTPEFLEASRKPGIGGPFYEEFKNEIYPRDEIIINAQQCKPPRAYDKKFEQAGGDLQKIKEQRMALAKTKTEHQTPERLKVRERVKKLHLKNQLKRRYEDEDSDGSI